ncbi:DUF4345 family protein [Actinomadura verrucosospora]|uniref:DUF4345 domain-containing protein n=1 Tax=Actinomadura verrucosospora TaxID=46165 RepID=A0A7D3W051_ACTVE|nr:DUF4345 family protein [Actinomadura verrucosospora]QKG27110.1 hypothetical protein ACTIVE_8763 [Actinomadura verrucosospora]
MDDVLVVLVAVFFLGMGVLGLARPRTLIAPFGITLGSGEARTEVRAVYGGFGVAMAALLAYAAATHGGSRTGIVLTVAAALAGMAFGRLVSRAADKPAAFYPIWFYFWVELVGAAVLVAALL